MRPSVSTSDEKYFRDLIQKLRQTATAPVTFMEVCGTHTMSIGRAGIRSVMPETVKLISGPGCPVCVTADSEINAFMKLAKRDGVILATYGDMMKVPGTEGSLASLKAEGADIKVVYSGFDALEIARNHPERQIVFLGVGFETTAPATAHAVKTAKAEGLRNFSIFNIHKTVPQALCVLLEDPETNIDGFLLPGHVSVIIGEEPYRFMVTEYGVSGAITGFEPPEIAASVLALVKHYNANEPAIINLYPAAVKPEGNTAAQALLAEVFKPSDAEWRGIGVIPGSGLKLTESYAGFDAGARFDIKLEPAPPLKGCRCGDILKGRISPSECPLFGRRCTPDSPIGPCMVSSEGTCAAYFLYSPPDEEAPEREA